MTPKWKKRGLCLIFPILLGSVISSVVATEWHGRIGRLGFKYVKTIKQQLDQFIQASNHQSGTNSSGKITATTLISNLAQNPNSVPLLMVGFATQIAKSMFDGKLYEGTKFANNGKSLQAYLKNQKKQTEQLIKTKRNTEKRIKTDWSSDDERYLTGLREFILSKIDSRNIDSYYEQKEHTLTVKKHFQGKDIAFIGFLLSKWISKSQVGRFIHELLPYSDKFQDTTIELYGKKFQNVNLPSKPNFHFPDFNPSNIKKFEESWKYFLLQLGSHNNKQEDVQKKVTLHWVSEDNTPQKNFALKLLVDSKNNDGQNQHIFKGPSSFLAAWWDQQKNQLLNLFRIKDNSSESQSRRVSSEVSNSFFEFLIHSKENGGSGGKASNKIIFWRDDKGFNLLFPVPEKINGKQKENTNKEESEQFHKSKETWVESFKEYIKENFPYLLLKYYLHIKGCNENSKSQKTCCCEDIIKNLTNLWDLSKKLIELNNSLKIWDLRSKNNTFLKTVDYSRESSYLSKLGTVSANPPTFLSKVSFEEEIKSIKETIKEHLQKVKGYFNSTSDKSSTTKLEGKRKNGKGDNKEYKYWTFNDDETSQKLNETNSNCMKKNVAEFLLEKISTLDLLKNHLLLSISFDNILELFQNGKTTQTTAQTTKSSLEELEKKLSESYKEFFKFQNGSKVRSKRSASSSPQTNNEQLINLLRQAIKDELVVSHLGSISDTLLYKLSKNNSSGTQPQQTNSSNSFETIKDWLTINALSNKPLRTHNTLENAQLRLLITSLYLLENSLKEYREILKNIIKNDFFGSYVFSLSWNKFCTLDQNKNPLDPNKDEEGQRDSVSQGTGNGKNNFWSPINAQANGQQAVSNQEEEWSASGLDPRACIKNSDRFSIAKFKRGKGTNAGTTSTTNDSEMKLMGYKGSISRDSQILLPGNLYEKILDFLLKEGHITWTQIEQQVDLIKSNSQFSNFITQLTKVKSSIGQAFELPDYSKLKEDLDQSKRAEALEWLGLAKKKELLKEFIKKYLFSRNTDSSLQLTTASLTEGLSSTQINKNNKQNFKGLMWDKDSTDSRRKEKDNKQYIFSTRDENEGSALIYLIQYTHEDLKDEQTFVKFLKENLTPDMLIRDIVKKAQDKGLQSKAINHYLMRGSWATGDKVFNLKSNDYYLKDQFSSIIL